MLKHYFVQISLPRYVRHYRIQDKLELFQTVSVYPWTGLQDEVAVHSRPGPNAGDGGRLLENGVGARFAKDRNGNQPYGRRQGTSLLMLGVKRKRSDMLKLLYCEFAVHRC